MAKRINNNLIKIGNVYYFKKQRNGKKYKFSLSTNVERAREMRDEMLRNLTLYGTIYDPNSYKNVNGILFKVVQEKSIEANPNITDDTRRGYQSCIRKHITPVFFGKSQ